MLKLPFVLLFTAMTFFAWGVYGILLNFGQKEMGGSYLMPFVGVGFAYFVIAVLGAGAMLGGTSEKGSWSFLGTIYSLVAGSVGALGALGVILALANGGDPVYVMPLIFGGAPVINTLFTSWLNKTFDKITPLFVIGMILVCVGMIGVLSFKPHPGAKHAAPTKSASIDVDEAFIPGGRLVAADNTPTAAETTGVSSPTEQPSRKPFNFFYVSLSILTAVVCWGTYGPILHIGQMKMSGSRLRPFICVGLAYFGIAVILPLFMLQMGMDTSTGRLTLPGSLWSIAAGTAGAVGALGIILAFNSGGKPIFVMPLVFGFAPVVNTLVSLWNSQQLNVIVTNPIFTGALATIISGAVMVLVFAPKAGHGHGPKANGALPPLDNKPPLPAELPVTSPDPTSVATPDSSAESKADSETSKNNEPKPPESPS